MLPGSLDETFGMGGGIRIRHPGASACYVISAPDDRLLVAGRVRDPGRGDHLLLARITPDGRLDSTYGQSGRVPLPIQLGHDFKSLLVGAEGSATVLAGAGRAPAVMQVDGGGRATGPVFLRIPTVPSGFERYVAFDAPVMASDSVGRLLTAGRAMKAQAKNEDLVVTRYLNGSPDPSFGQEGTVATSMAGGVFLVRALLPDESDGVIVVGTLMLTGKSILAAFKFDAAGLLDSSFGQGGFLLVYEGELLSLVAASYLPDGRVAVCGNEAASSRPGPFAAIFPVANGYGVAKLLVRAVDLGDGDHTGSVRSMTVDRQGHLLLAGQFHGKSGSGVGLVRLEPTSGRVDPRFGINGLLTLGGDQRGSAAESVIIDVEGRIVIAVSEENESGLTLMRFAETVTSPVAGARIIRKDTPDELRIKQAAMLEQIAAENRMAQMINRGIY